MGLAAFIKAIYANQGRSGVLGTVVRREAAADPQNVWLTIFTITGQVLVTQFVGIRTVIQAGGASNMQFRHSVGATAGCVATAITGNAVGTLYTITGNPLDNLIIGPAGAPIQGGGAGSQTVASVQMFGSIMAAGNIQVTMTAAAGTGSTGYILTYVPLSADGVVVAA